MKRIGKALAGVLAAVFLGQAVLAAPLLGDVDGDGAVTAKDKMTLARYADGWEGYNIDEDAGDIDRDGDVDAEDAQRFGRYFAGYADDWGIGDAAEVEWDNPYIDVNMSDAYYNSVRFVHENNILRGMTQTKFEPNTTISRAQFATILGRLADIDYSAYNYPSIFTDLSYDNNSIAYAIPYINWCTEKGLLEGYGNGKFGPYDTITNAAAYTILSRYIWFIVNKDVDISDVEIDVDNAGQIPIWAEDSYKYAIKEKYLVINADKEVDNPSICITRGTLSMLFHRFCVNVLGWED